GSRAPGKDVRLCFLGGLFRPPAVGARCDLAPFRQRVRRTRCASRCVARASASRRAALQPALRGAPCRLQAPVPALAQAAAATADPQATLARGVDLVEAIASRAAYLALLAENPQALERVTRIIGASSWAAEFLTRHPLLLDELLDDCLLYAPPELDA